MMLLRDMMVWIIQAVLFGIGIGFAGLTAHLAGPLLATAFAIDEFDPDRGHLFCGDGGLRLDRKQVLARRLAVQSPALAMAFCAGGGCYRGIASAR